jgi:dihydrofolate synthase/folylpolyglutamate synthase
VNFNESLAYLESHINLEVTAGLIHGLSLDHMQSLVGVLGDPQEAFPVIHVTGTNGKGSTARMITALLVEHGLSVGTYSSPHLQRINERISWNGEAISDEQFASVITEIARVAPLSGITPSYFELLTAAALLWFAESAVDVAVVEVGLLGRYDATNVCEADVAVITNIGRDHTDGEGEWEQAIATEKAGIITGTSTLVTGVTDSTLKAIFDAEGPERMYAADVDYEVISDLYAVGGHLIDLRTPFGTYEDLLVPLHGAHQSDNAATAIVAVESFFDRLLDETVVQEAFRSVTMPGRFEVVSHSPLLILDGAHNPDGARAARRVLVVGMLGGRDVVEMLESLDVRNADLVIACTPDSPRAVAAVDVAAVVRAMGVMVEQIDDVPTAVQRAIDVSTEDDVILVAGSLYVAGSARTAVEDFGRRGE